MSVLDKIIEVKKTEIAEAKKSRPIALLQQQSLQNPPRGFQKTLSLTSFPAIIAEIKRASPSKGLIRPDLNPVDTARAYRDGGAACISVLTDKQFFSGDLFFLTEIRRAVPQIPLLRKDFIIDSYQLWEARAFGADAVLLIAKALAPSLLFSLFAEAQEVGLDVLLEVHNKEEAELALELLMTCLKKDSFNLPLLGINNRNLSNFITDLSTTAEVINYLKAKIPVSYSAQLCNNLRIVSESGIFAAEDIFNLTGFGAHAFLVGESLVAKGNPGENLKALIDKSRILSSNKK